MNQRTSAIVMLVVGVGLLVWGFDLSGAFESQVSRAFTGSPTDKAKWAMIGGGVLAALGGFQLLVRKV